VRVSRCEEHPAPPRARGGFEEALERAASAVASGPGARLAEPGLPELREACRAIPPCLWSGQVGREKTVELAFGRDVRIELRQAAGGIEVTVRVTAPLLRAARGDLPALVAALRERGVEVPRADVRGYPRGGGATGSRSASR